MTAKNTATKSETVKAPKAKKPAKKITPPTSNGKVEIKLRKPQVRILKALVKVKDGGSLDHAQIAEKAPVDTAWVADNLYGRHDAAARKEREAKVGPSLLTLGYVRQIVSTKDAAKAGETVEERSYVITAAGKKALTKIVE